MIFFGSCYSTASFPGRSADAGLAVGPGAARSAETENGKSAKDPVSPEWVAVDGFLSHCYNFLEPHTRKSGVLIFA